jgi:hypothetical protein
MGRNFLRLEDHESFKNPPAPIKKTIDVLPKGFLITSAGNKNFVLLESILGIKRLDTSNPCFIIKAGAKMIVLESSETLSSNLKSHFKKWSDLFGVRINNTLLECIITEQIGLSMFDFKIYFKGVHDCYVLANLNCNSDDVSSKLKTLL